MTQGISLCCTVRDFPRLSAQLLDRDGLLRAMLTKRTAEAMLRREESHKMLLAPVLVSDNSVDEIIEDAGLVRACGCGRTYTREEWDALPALGIETYGHRTLDHRQCACGSTLALPVGGIR
jgi:hypothetical protein